MGKRPPPAKSLKDCARVAAERLKSARKAKPAAPLKSLDSNSVAGSSTSAAAAGRAAAVSGGGQRRLRLSEVVADCVRRWFEDALKDAQAGDAAMQVLVAQMYQSGYGVPRNEQKAKLWITKASKYRPSVWDVSEKHPGYNASDSDSDEMKDDM